MLGVHRQEIRFETVYLIVVTVVVSLVQENQQETRYAVVVVGEIQQEMIY